jgi:hypothetical protein
MRRAFHVYYNTFQFKTKPRELAGDRSAVGLKTHDIMTIDEVWGRRMSEEPLCVKGEILFNAFSASCTSNT